MVSICIDVFNYARFLPQAIESVLEQTYTDFEVLISDDCSTDRSFDIAQEYAAKDPRIRAQRNPTNLGMVKNRNACLAMAQRPYVKFLHADDFLCDREALAKMVAVLEANPAVSLVAAARKMVDIDGQPKDVWSCFSDERPVSGTSVINRCLREQRNLIGGPSAVMVRRDRALRGFSEEYFVMADMEMWFHLLEQGCFAYLREPLCAFRMHGTQQTQKDVTSMLPAIENWKLISSYLDRPYVKVRSWLRRYLAYDAVHRIVKRSRKLGIDPANGNEEIARALKGYSGLKYYRRQARRVFYEAFVKQSRLVQRHVLPWLSTRLTSRAGKQRPLGINMAGFVRGEYGIGESSRALWRAVEGSGLPCALINVHSRMHSNRDATFTRFAADNPYQINLMTFSFDYSRRFYRDMGRKYFAGRYNIGLWYWEQEIFPARWHSAFDYYDEIWVPTEFTRKSIASVSPVPVRKITYPLYVNEAEARPDRASFGLKDDTFVFLFNFDFLSTTHRKNPAGVIDAFRKAFSPTEDVTLVLKTINSEHDRAGRELLARRGEGLKIVFLDSHLPGAQVNALFASADCYISLHRSEGLGLGMAQSMYLGKPVIGTGYSGNLDFMSRENSLLVDYEMAAMEETNGPYEKGSVWAQPSSDHAAEHMRWVYKNREESMALGQRAARDIRETLSAQRTSQEILARAREIGAMGREGYACSVRADS